MRGKALTADEIERRLRAEFPETFHAVSGLYVADAGQAQARVELEPTAASVRPGGTVSGPTLMMLVDVDRYVVAALYLVASTVGGLTAAFAGAAIARMAAS